MSHRKWKDSPHEKIFWIAVIVLAVVLLLLFAQRVVGW